MRRFDNNAQGTMLLGFAIVVGMIALTFWLLGGFSSDAIEIYESGTINYVNSFPQKFKLTVAVDWKDYDKSFKHSYQLENYQAWLVQWIGYEVDFYYYEGGYFYDLYVHDTKNVTIKQVRYKEDGWWDKPPMRVVFSDGDAFSFSGSSEYKFDMYAMFIAFDNEYVSIDYSFDFDNDIRIHSIERIEEVD